MSKRYYESYFIVDGNLEESAIEEIIKKYESFLQKNNAELKNLEKIGRRRLAYQIKRRQNGYYVAMEFESSPEIISKLERTYRLDDNILRSLTTYLDKRTLKERNDYLKKREQMIEQMDAEKTAAELPAADKGSKRSGKEENVKEEVSQEG